MTSYNITPFFLFNYKRTYIRNTSLSSQTNVPVHLPSSLSLTNVFDDTFKLKEEKIKCPMSCYSHCDMDYTIIKEVK